MCSSNTRQWPKAARNYRAIRSEPIGTVDTPLTRFRKPPSQLDRRGCSPCLHVAGPQHVTLLRHLSPYDFGTLGIGRCVSTVVPKAGVTMLRGDDQGVLLLFRRSFADWIWRLVERSAKPYGLAVCAPHDLPAPAFAALDP